MYISDYRPGASLRPATTGEAAALLLAIVTSDLDLFLDDIELSDLGCLEFLCSEGVVMDAGGVLELLDNGLRAKPPEDSIRLLAIEDTTGDGVNASNGVETLDCAFLWVKLLELLLEEVIVCNLLDELLDGDTIRDWFSNCDGVSTLDFLDELCEVALLELPVRDLTGESPGTGVVTLDLDFLGDPVGVYLLGLLEGDTTGEGVTVCRCSSTSSMSIAMVMFRWVDVILGEKFLDVFGKV